MSDRNLDHLYPDFREAYVKVLRDMIVYLDKNHPGLSCKLVEGFRSAAYQHEIWQKGRDSNGNVIGTTYTNCDGYKNKSNHQSSLAADIGIFRGKEYLGDPPQSVMAYYGHLVRKHGLAWGGNWKKPDFPHAEWKPSDRNLYAKARAWQKTQGLR